MIITSLLDTDLYKFTMMQVVLHQFPGAQVEYRFKCRNAGSPGISALAPMANEIRQEIHALCVLRFQDAELAYLRSMRFIKSDFVDFLGLFRLNDKYVTVTALPSGEIDVLIQGPWLHTILFEIPVLAIINEVYFRNTQKLPDLLEGSRRLDSKVELLKAEGAKRALLLQVSAPFHSSLMKPAAEKLQEKLAETFFAALQIPLINNIDVAVPTDAAGIRDALYRQAFGAVRWVECVQAMKARGVSHVVECGPGKVLAGLVKRIDADLTGAPLFDPASMAQVKELLV